MAGGKAYLRAQQHVNIALRRRHGRQIAPELLLDYLIGLELLRLYLFQYQVVGYDYRVIARAPVSVHHLGRRHFAACANFAGMHMCVYLFHIKALLE